MDKVYKSRLEKVTLLANISYKFKRVKKLYKITQSQLFGWNRIMHNVTPGYLVLVILRVWCMLNNIFDVRTTRYGTSYSAFSDER